MLYKEIIAVCFQIHTKHINTLCGQNVELLNGKLAVHILTTELWRVYECPPLLLMLQPQLMAKYGYPVETHSVQTEDGYILELHRIPHGKLGPANSTRPAVLLHHALLCSSFDWVGLGPEKSLGRSSAISWSLHVPLVAFRPSLPGCDVESRAERQIPAASLSQFKSRLCQHTSLLLCSFLSSLFE